MSSIQMVKSYESFQDYIGDASDEELIKEAKGIYSAIYDTGCFDSKDVTRLDIACDELTKRGYEVDDRSALEVTKP